MPSPIPDADCLPPAGTFHEVAGRRLLLDRAGHGAPAVVFLPGGGMFGLGYYLLHRAAAAQAASVIYDRAGTGWSDPVPLPRSALDVVMELRSLLQAAGVPGPYLLVGHSLGGLYARRYLQRFPSEVAGLLLLDPAHEDYPAHEPEVARRAAEEWKGRPLPEFTPEQIEGYRPILGAMYAAWPPALRGPLIERHLSPAQVRAGLLEASNVDALYDEMRLGGATAPVPTIIYTAMGVDATQRAFSTDEVIAAQNAAKLGSHAACARSVPGAEHRVLPDASHAMLHIQETETVLQGLRDLLGRIRVGGK